MQSHTSGSSPNFHFTFSSSFYCLSSSLSVSSSVLLPSPLLPEEVPNLYVVHLPLQLLEEVLNSTLITVLHCGWMYIIGLANFINLLEKA